MRGHHLDNEYSVMIGSLTKNNEGVTMKDIKGAIGGYLLGFWSSKWAFYNIAFKIIGHTPLWPKASKVLW